MSPPVCSVTDPFIYPPPWETEAHRPISENAATEWSDGLPFIHLFKQLWVQTLLGKDLCEKKKICVKKGWGWVALCANLEPPPEYMLSKESKVQPSVT